MKTLTVNPVVLILINIIAPSMYIFINGRYLQFFLLGYAICMLLLMGSYKHALTVTLVWSLFYAAGYFSVIYHKFEGFGMVFAVMSQTLPCIALAVVLIKKYTSAELLSALETLRIPRVLVVAVTVTIKYIPTFKREFSYITESMRLRGIEFSPLKPIRSFKYFIVPQLFRCSALAEEVTSAGLVKGIDAPIRRSSYYEEKLRVSDVLVLLVFVIGLTGGLIWQRR
jgi:energy-coupling factor transport system permease protein